jgi:hypothetical protein
VPSRRLAPVPSPPPFLRKETNPATLPAKGGRMKNSDIHPFWKWAWRMMLGIMLIPFILLPLKIVIVILADILFSLSGY